MFPYLQIYEPRERALVAAADAVLRVTTPVLRLLRRAAPAVPQRILLMRIERIGDLLMTLGAIADAAAAAPSAEIDLAVGSWNADIARHIAGVRRVRTMDAVWLARDGTGQGLASLAAIARSWSAARYDLAINFEPDIRSHLLMAAAGAARTAGFSSGGGGPLLDVSLPFDPRLSTALNARRLVAAALDAGPGDRRARLELPAEARERAASLMGDAGRPLVGIHTSGGREIKQWPPERFGEVAVRLARERGATMVLTGTAADRPIVEVVRRMLDPHAVIDMVGFADLLTLAAVLERLDVYVTGDTGPMHLAAAVGTPVVAVFGPSDPVRYAPEGPAHRIVRIDLPCSPCNRIRLPPARCVGHTPDCLAGLPVDTVYRAAADTLDARSRSGGGSTPGAGASSRLDAFPGGTAGRSTSREARRTPHVPRGTVHAARRTPHAAGPVRHDAHRTLPVARESRRT